jgi:hypothetical protein
VQPRFDLLQPERRCHLSLQRATGPIGPAHVQLVGVQFAGVAHTPVQKGLVAPPVVRRRTGRSQRLRSRRRQRAC